MASAIARKRAARSGGAWYQTVRPCLLAVSTPDRARVARCRATIEKSRSQHWAISVTEQGRLHLIRQARSLDRVGSASALKSSGSRSESSRDRRRAACLGLAGCLNTCVTMQVYYRAGSCQGLGRGGRRIGPTIRI